MAAHVSGAVVLAAAEAVAMVAASSGMQRMGITVTAVRRVPAGPTAGDGLRPAPGPPKVLRPCQLPFRWCAGSCAVTSLAL